MLTQPFHKTPFSAFFSSSTRLHFNQKLQNFLIFCSKCLNLVHFQFQGLKISQKCYIRTISHVLHMHIVHVMYTYIAYMKFCRFLSNVRLFSSFVNKNYQSRDHQHAHTHIFVEHHRTTTPTANFSMVVPYILAYYSHVILLYRGLMEFCRFMSM